MNPKRDQHLCFAAYKERDKGSDRPKQTSTPHLRTAVCLVPTVPITHYYPSTPSLKLLCGKTQNCYHQPVLQPCITKTSIALWQALIKIQNSTLDIPYLCNELCKTSTQNSILRSCLSSQWLSPLNPKISSSIKSSLRCCWCPTGGLFCHIYLLHFWRREAFLRTKRLISPMEPHPSMGPFTPRTILLRHPTSSLIIITWQIIVLLGRCILLLRRLRFKSRTSVLANTTAILNSISLASICCSAYWQALNNTTLCWRPSASGAWCMNQP